MAATGREVRVSYCMVYELEGEKIGALRGYMPMDVLMGRIGGSPSPKQRAEPLGRTDYRAARRASRGH